MNWERIEDREYDEVIFAPELDGEVNDPTHASGSLIYESGTEVCCVCRKTGQCIRYSNHRFCDTDDIDLNLCSRCLEKGIDVILGKGR